MPPADLGAFEAEYKLNGDVWGRSILALGFMIVIGCIVFGLGCYQSIQSGTPVWILLVIGPLLAGMAVYALCQLRPRLLSLAVHENGLFIDERDRQTAIRWTDIAHIEESTLRAGSTDVVQLLLRTDEQNGLLVCSLTLEKFDDFLATMQKRAAAHAITWVYRGAQPLGR